MSENDQVAQTPENTYNPVDTLPHNEESHATPTESEVPETWDDTPDDKAIAQTRKDSQLPRGKYHTIPELRVFRVKGDDGRRSAVLTGKVIGADKRTLGSEGLVQFWVSPDRRNKDDGKTPDHSSKMWQQAYDALQRVLGKETKIKSSEEVLSWLQNYAVQLEVSPGTSNSFVAAIREIKEG